MQNLVVGWRKYFDGVAMLKHLIDKVLVEDTKKLVVLEIKTTAEILKYLEEIDRQSLLLMSAYRPSWT